MEQDPQREAIIKQFGQPQRDFDKTPLNEAAVRIDALNKAKLQAFNEEKKKKKLERLAKTLNTQEVRKIDVPEYLIKPEWIKSFTEAEQRIISVWIKDVNQTPDLIASITGDTRKAVNALFRSEAFAVLYKHVAEALITTATIPAIIVMKEEMIYGANPNVRNNAAQAFLKSAGMLRFENTEDDKESKRFDPATEKKLKDIGEAYRKLSKENQETLSIPPTPEI